MFPLPASPFFPVLSETSKAFLLLWKRTDRTAPAAASCVAGCNSVISPPQEKPFIQSLSHVGICSRREPEAMWNCGLRSLEEGDHRKAKRQAELMAIWKSKVQSSQQICVIWPQERMWIDRVCSFSYILSPDLFVPEWLFLQHKQQVITEKAAFIPLFICQRCWGTDGADGDVLLLSFILRSSSGFTPGGSGCTVWQVLSI